MYDSNHWQVCNTYPTSFRRAFFVIPSALPFVACKSTWESWWGSRYSGRDQRISCPAQTYNIGSHARPCLFFRGDRAQMWGMCVVGLMCEGPAMMSFLDWAGHPTPWSCFIIAPWVTNLENGPCTILSSSTSSLWMRPWIHWEVGCVSGMSDNNKICCEIG